MNIFTIIIICIVAYIMYLLYTFNNKLVEHLTFKQKRGRRINIPKQISKYPNRAINPWDEWIKRERSTVYDKYLEDEYVPLLKQKICQQGVMNSNAIPICLL